MATTTKKPAAKNAQPIPMIYLVPPGADGLLTKAQICRLLTISETRLKEMIRTGEYPTPSTHLGNRPRWTVATHNDWLARRCSGGGTA